MKLLLCPGLAFLLVSCAASTPDITNLADYKVYVSELASDISTADSSSFAEGEQQLIMAVSQQILAALENVERFDDLDDNRREDLLVLNSELHVLMVGEDESLAAGRICTTQVSTGSNIRNRVCRTRDQLTRERLAARQLLYERTDDIDRTLIEDSRRESLPDFDF